MQTFDKLRKSNSKFTKYWEQQRKNGVDLLVSVVLFDNTAARQYPPVHIVSSLVAMLN